MSGKPGIMLGRSEKVLGKTGKPDTAEYYKILPDTAGYCRPIGSNWGPIYVFQCFSMFVRDSAECFCLFYAQQVNWFGMRAVLCLRLISRCVIFLNLATIS